MKALFFIFFLALVGQINAQEHLQLDTLKAPADLENISVKKLCTDTNSTSFVIWVKKGVKLHKHAHHSETIYVLEGEGIMTLGDEEISIKPGDFIFIPENTPHDLEVTSDIPVKVISVQAPEFDGSDRIFIE